MLFPDQGLTKGELIAYVAVVADWMLPHVADRPLSIVRCPDGQPKPCFYQKHVLPGAPPPIRRIPIDEVDGEVIEYMAIDDMAGLVALAQFGTLEIHTWGAHAAPSACGNYFGGAGLSNVFGSNFGSSSTLLSSSLVSRAPVLCRLCATFSPPTSL